MTTRSFRVNGINWQERVISCGRSGCQRCAARKFHRKFYRYDSASQRMIYAGTKPPQQEPNYQPPICANPGCTNYVRPHGRAKYCSDRCRIQAYRSRKQEQLSKATAT